MVNSYELVLPEKKDELIEFLCSDLFPIGEKTAKKIVDKFKEETLDIIYDKAAPQLEMSNASSITSGSNITLSGKVWDSYGLKESESVEIVVKNESGTQVTTYKPSVTEAITKVNIKTIFGDSRFSFCIMFVHLV